MTKVSLQTAEIRVFKQLDAEHYIAKFVPYKHYPVFFHGPTADGVLKEAEAFRSGAAKPPEDDVEDLLS